MKYYNRTNTCDRCREEGRETKLEPGKAYSEKDNNKNWTGRWLCNKCHSKNYNKEYNKRPDSHCNIIKSFRDRRTGNLNPNSSQAKGDNFEELTRIWRSMVSVIPVENLNKKLDNYNSPIDHSRDSELGIPQTKGRLYNSKNGLWSFGGLERESGKKFDVIICYCASKDGKIIERLYIFPKEEIEDMKGITITRDSSRRAAWYEKYRIKDEETLKNINDIWNKIIGDKI